MRFDGKTAIVTGGANGIGRACVERFVREGAKVVIADTDEEGEKLAEDLRKENGEARFIYCDVGERLDVRNLLAGTLEAYGGVDILVNNAGILVGASFLEIKEKDFDRVLRINLKGAFLVGQAVARQMVAQIEQDRAPGAIVNISSINAVFAIPDQVPYSISKGGMNQLTKVMALALAPHGIRVNGVGPGSIMTRMLESITVDMEAKRRVLSRTPMGRVGEPAEIAAIVAFLASEEASYMTGQTVYADGGRLPLNYTVPVAGEA